ncbi:MAG: 3-dehydroquinate synthase [Clostridia bacterium]|nr:3-dehydroquinate synthase [Clostridia bacterium]
MIIPVKTSAGNYNIILERGVLKRAAEHTDLKRKVLIVTDNGVPCKYAQAVADQCAQPYIAVIDQGEGSKNLKTFEYLLSCLVENGFTRSDCIVAVGGGVVGDLSGFAASCYMRGIDFYNIPTTLLSQVDSSVGGKTAVDFMGLKNLVGAFYPPKAVVIDPETLETLPKRQLSNGLAESLKMSLTHDKSLFEIFENGEADKADKNIETVIERSLLIKKSVVEADEREGGLRRVLNFGHTLAHAIETVNSLSNYYHGECVAMGMLPMCSESVRPRLINALKALNLPYELATGDADLIIDACRHDKKLTGRDITVVYVESVGDFEFRKMPFDEFEKIIRQVICK